MMGFKPNYVDAVYNLTNGKINGGNPEGGMSEIIFHEGVTPPEESAVQAELSSLIEAWEAQEYARNRASSYPPIGDQLDMIYKDMKNGTTTHAEAVEEVKTKYPKG